MSLLRNRRKSAALDAINWEVAFESDYGLFQDAARTVPCTAEGQPVAGWADRSGNERHGSIGATQAGTYRMSAVNGLPALDFTAPGGDTGLQFSAIDSTGAFTRIVVVKSSGVTAMYWSQAGANFNSKEGRVNANYYIRAVENGTGFTKPWTPGTAWTTVTVMRDGAGAMWFGFGQDALVSLGTATGTSVVSKICYSTPGQKWRDLLAAGYVANYALSTTQLNSFRGGLSAKYNIP